MLIDASAIIETDGRSPSVCVAAADVRRDLAAVCGFADDTRENSATADVVRIALKDDSFPCEGMFRITADAENRTLAISAGDDFGFIYGLYHISRELLGVPDLWFWMDWRPPHAGAVEVPDDYRFESQPFAVAERGWFVNDEVLLMGWSLDNDPDLPWQMVFEALLRCGGNMVIPGTGNNSARHAVAAVARGLKIAQHHAEPLGARLFSSAYPDFNPSWDEHKDLFIGLWRESLAAHAGQHVIWNVGFRGQGDSPFWCADPSYDTDEKRGALMSEIIRLQRAMVLESDPAARCCVYLYGETLELYRQGMLNLPDDVIKIWSDNGFGRMVTRRQGNHNPRVDAMPNPNDHGAQGIYYHASFYDLQAANHITTLPNQPAHIIRELGAVLARGGDAFWVVNSSNVKPHAYYLDLIARLWRGGAPAQAAAADTDCARNAIDPACQSIADQQTWDFAATYYGESDACMVAGAYQAYFDAAVPFGEHWDEHAAEQYFNHGPRELITQFMRDRTAPCSDLIWATGERPLIEQIGIVDKAAVSGMERYDTLGKRNIATADGMTDHAARLFDDSIALHTRIYAHCCKATHLVCEALRDGLQSEWQQAFWHAGLARREFQRARKAMLSREHGRWHGFYANECLTDVAQSAWVVSGLMAFLRTMGDGPHFYQWQRDFIYSREEAKVTTLLNLENHLTDDELFDAMLVKWEDAGTEAMYRRVD
ncbi:glycosyl hydrolase 115 family protein [Bifidobacterium oedipodis]|uniref:Glycosyl hydrolase family n=1 Tax=Bifidobacterium oedipodis TaxID=2675322 RepID=A0A7Y0EMQ3_9BIFI|nr:glycosyl hydrolase 115 family protein [Bifidobacterium sp. DSM 109957]NMM93080.1 Glycosyl hydrolase family [Bifidobacterium sp. DSM 109957]